LDKYFFSEKHVTHLTLWTLLTSEKKKWQNISKTSPPMVASSQGIPTLFQTTLREIKGKH